MTEKKMTKKEKYAILLAMEAVKARPDLVKFIEHEVELLDRKNSKDRKKTPQQEVNEKIKEKILEILDEPKTATAIMIAVEPYFPETTLSNQRISAILRTMGEKGTGEIIRYVEKRRTLFKRAEEQVED